MAWNTTPSSRRCSSSGRLMHTPEQVRDPLFSATSSSTRAIWSRVQVRYEMLQPRALLDRVQRPTEDTSRSDRGGAASGPPREGAQRPGSPPPFDELATRLLQAFTLQGRALARESAARIEAVRRAEGASLASAGPLAHAAPAACSRPPTPAKRAAR